MAAIVIIAVIIGLASVANSVKTSDNDEAFYDLSREISYETKAVLDYGVYTKADTPTLVEGFLEEYANYISQDQVIFIFGNSQKLDALSSETKRLETIYQKKLDELEDLKQSILHKAFNGELS